MSDRKTGFAATLGASVGGGVLGGALLSLGEFAWIAAHSVNPVDPFVAGYGLLLYGGAGLLWGFGLGLVMAVLRRLLGRTSGVPAGFYTVSAGLILVFMGFPVAKFLIGRDVFMERLSWTSLAGVGIQAAILASLCAMFFLLVLGVRRLLERAPRWVSGPWLTPLAVVAAAALTMVLPGHDGARSARDEGADPPPGAPNIVLVMVDTLRADVTDPYGAEGLTPNLGELASRGVTFINAHAHSSWTRPSVATVLSGRYPSSHGAMFKMDLLPDEVDTIAEQLSEVGYHTHGIVSNYVTAPYFNFGQGFDRYDYLEPSYFLGASEVSSKFNLYELLRKIHQKLLPGAVEPNAQYRDGAEVTAAAVQWLDGYESRRSAEDRYFLFVQYMEPHDPYFAHPDDGRAPSRKAMPHPPASMRDRMWSLYEGEVSYWDTQFGLLVSRLEQMDGFEDTLILVFSDHGEEFLEHGGWWHGDTMYEEAIRVPLVMRLPGDEAAGTVIEDLVGLVDVAPTLVRMGGGAIPSTYQGEDLFAARDAPLFGEEQHVGNDIQSLVYRRDDGGIWKVITCNEENPRGLPPRSLFDLSSDPGEKENLADVNRPELELALEMLARAMKEAARGAVEKKSVEIDEASRRRLQELGYIQDEE